MVSKLWQRIHARRLAYLRTFMGQDGKPHPEGAKVLADLKRYCGISRGGIVTSPVTRMVDPLATAYRAGQRDTYLRIVHYLGLEKSLIEEEADNDPADTEQS